MYSNQQGLLAGTLNPLIGPVFLRNLNLQKRTNFNHFKYKINMSMWHMINLDKRNDFVKSGIQEYCTPVPDGLEIIRNHDPHKPSSSTLIYQGPL